MMGMAYRVRGKACISLSLFLSERSVCDVVVECVRFTELRAVRCVSCECESWGVAVVQLRKDRRENLVAYLHSVVFAERMFYVQRPSPHTT